MISSSFSDEEYHLFYKIWNQVSKWIFYSEINSLREPPQENNHISYCDILNVHKPEQKLHVLKFSFTGACFVEYTIHTES